MPAPSIILLTILLLATIAPAQPAPAPSLEATLKAARWRQRVLLICAPTAAGAAQQQELLQPARAGLAERDLLVRALVLPNLNAPDRQYLRQLGVKDDTFQVLLIGKDGGVKRRDTTPVTPAALFATIDGMPMRRQEMKRM